MNWTVILPLINCPSDTGTVPPRGGPGSGTYSYAFCGGDSYLASVVHPTERTNGTLAALTLPMPSRGVFGRGAGTRLQDIKDGASNTIAVAERARPIHDRDRGMVMTIATGNPWAVIPSTCAALWQGNQYSASAVVFTQDTSPGYRWGDGAAFFQGVTTILRPNSAACLLGDPDFATGGGHYSPGIWTPTSRHLGGVTVGMADGSVRFISDNIDSGNSATVAPGPPAVAISPAPPAPLPPTPGAPRSPYGVWGALGTKAGAEVLGEF